MGDGECANHSLDKSQMQNSQMLDAHVWQVGKHKGKE